LIRCNSHNLIETNELIKVVQDMIRIPSVVPPGAEKQVVEYVIGYMEANGIKTNIQEVLPERCNVVARLKGKGISTPIMFTGHMDVVPVEGEERKYWNTEPFSGELNNGYIYGRGASDMKGGLGAVMVAMATLAKNKIQPPGDIILAATVDEEGMMLGSKALVKSNLISDASRIIVCEPTNMELVTACKGRTWAEVTVEGRAAHASKQGAGINAIDRAVILAKKINNYRVPHQPHDILGNSFWQNTLINGGLGHAIIPDKCTITVDARLVPGQMPDDIWGEMEKLISEIKEEINGFEAVINVIERREPWDTSHDDKLVKVISGAYDCLNIPLLYGGFSGTTDGTIFRRNGIDAVIIGPGDIACAHKENEKVSIEQLTQAAQIYILTMMLWV